MLIGCSKVKEEEAKPNQPTKTNKKSQAKKWFVADGMTWESLLYQGVQEDGTLE